MDIPLNVDVYGTNGRIGQSTRIIVNPVSQAVTHLVVRDDETPHEEYLVAVRQIEDSDTDMIRLDCTGEQVSGMETFQEVEFMPTTVPLYEMPASMGGAYAWPYVTARPEARFVEVVHRHIPPYERDIRRGAHVHAKDGRVGQVDELVVDKSTYHLTHLVLREGHLWGQKDVLIPVDAIEDISENDISLKLDKKAIAALPTFPVHRHIQHVT
ncbi:MAG: PRC-barrel domain-containing protein [Anaerolineales bacterium]|nr:PRC-barrel domain-containing protein [Anaerolineales bacterium]